MVRTTGSEGGGASGYTTSYVTNVVSTLVVDLSKPVASRITSYLITAYITPPPEYVTKYITGIIRRITALVTRYYLDGKLYTELVTPTNIVVGTEYVTGPVSAGGGGGGSTTPATVPAGGGGLPGGGIQPPALPLERGAETPSVSPGAPVVAVPGKTLARVVRSRRGKPRRRRMVTL